MIFLTPRLREAVTERDKGICAECGMDTVAVGGALGRLSELAASQAQAISCRFARGREEWSIFKRLAIEHIGRVPFFNRRTRITYAIHRDPNERINIYLEPAENIVTMCDWCYWPEYHARSSAMFARAQHQSQRLVQTTLF